MLKGKKIDISKIIITIFMTIIAIVMLLPLVWMISASSKFEIDVFAYPIQWIPTKWNMIDNYYTVIFENQFIRNYINSFIQTGGTVVFSLIFASMSAYAFTKINFRGRDKIFIFLLALMMIPPQLTLIPRFMIVQKLHLYNTLLSLILMESFSIYGIFLLRQFMLVVPDSICESGRIDGAGHWTIFTRIVFPMMKPALCTLGILKAVWAWNDYQGPLIFLSSKSKFTVQLAVQQFAAADGLSPIYSLIMAGATIATVPLIIVFILFQAQVIEGIAVGAVKG